MVSKSIPKANQDEAKKEKKSEAKKDRFRIGLGTKNVSEGKTGRVSYKAAGGGRGDQDPLKTAQKHPRPSKEGPRAPKSGPRPPQDGPRASPGALLERSWSHLGTI